MKKFVFLFLFISPVVVADSCPAPLEQTAVQVKDLVARAGQMRSVEDFLKELPRTMTSNFIFIGESRSFQTASVDNPRVILTSPNGDVRLSFNTEAGQRGFNNIEISFWNPEKKKFDYQELSFSRDGQKPPSHNDGLACTICHGDPSKPNWDSEIPGSIPSSRDTLVKDTPQLNWYTALIGKTAVREPGNRLQYLTPLETNDEVTNSLAAKPSYVRKFLTDQGVQSSADGGISTRLFQKLQERQQCQQTKIYGKHSLYPKFKYILAGLQNSCNMSGFVPDWFGKLAGDYFYGILPNLSREEITNFNIQTLQKITSEAQGRNEEDRLARETLFVQRSVGAAAAPADSPVQSVVPGAGFVKDAAIRKPAADQMGMLRYFLEPLGVPVSTLSTSVDPTSYGVNENFRSNFLSSENLASIEAEATARGGSKCEALSALSRGAFEDDSLRQQLTNDAQLLCEKRDARETGIIDAQSLGANVIQFQAQEAFNKRCAQCHNATSPRIGYTVGGAPVIPFKNIQTLRAAIRSPQGQLTKLAERIQDRITRPDHFPGAMPLNGMTSVTKEENIYMNAWIKSQIGAPQ